MDLSCPVGPEGNLLDLSEKDSSRLIVDHPVLLPKEMNAVKTSSHNGWYSAVIDATISLDDSVGLSDGAKLSQALDLICAQATSAIETQNAPIIVLSHENVSETRVAVRSSNNSLVIIHVSTIDHVHRYPHLLQSVLYINIFFEHD